MQIRTVAALVVLASNAMLGQSSSPLKTDAMWNGRLWRTLTAPQRESFVLAYGEGSVLGLMTGTGLDKATYEKLVKEMWPSGMSYEEIVASLDRLFDPPENRGIGISDGIHLVAERAYGKEESKIQEELLIIGAHANGNR